MNETFFKNGFLTSTEAQNICNVAKEAVASEHEKLRNISFYSTEITSIVNPSSSIKSKQGINDINWIAESICKIGKYNALNAWLKEAIKAKDAEIDRIDNLDIEAYPDYVEYEKPEMVHCPSIQMSELEIINNWDTDRLNKYYSLNSKAAAIGAYIHDAGSIATARKDLINKLANPSAVNGSGRETIIYKYTPSVLAAGVESMFMKLLAEHRGLNAQLNKMKAEAKEEANTLNIKKQQEYREKQEEYDRKLSEYYNLVKIQNSKFAEYVISEKEKVSKLKINIPESLMDTYKEVKSLISE